MEKKKEITKRMLPKRIITKERAIEIVSKLTETHKEFKWYLEQERKTDKFNRYPATIQKAINDQEDIIKSLQVLITSKQDRELELIEKVWSYQYTKDKMCRKEPHRVMIQKYNGNGATHGFTGKTKEITIEKALNNL